MIFPISAIFLRWPIPPWSTTSSKTDRTGQASSLGHGSDTQHEIFASRALVLLTMRALFPCVIRFKLRPPGNCKNLWTDDGDGGARSREPDGTGYGVGDVIVSAGSMIDRVTPTARCSSLQ